MRITNQMSANKMLTQINRNMALVDLYNTQGSTGKLITMPSDDPIIASRSLKYSTMISESEQYAKNAAQSTSWIDATEAVFNNLEQGVLVDMKGIVTLASNDSYSTADRLIIIEQMASLTAQLEQELNTTYMGRYLFAGYKTDEAPITQDEDGNNILNTTVYGNTGLMIDYENYPDVTITETENGGYTIDPEAALIENDGTGVGYEVDEETGEYVKVSSIEGQLINVQVGANVTVEINTLASDIYSIDDYTEIRGGSFVDETIVDPSMRNPDDPTQMINPLPDEPLFPSLPEGFTYTGDTEFERITNFLNSDEYKNMSDEEKIAWENLEENNLQELMSSMITTVENLATQVATASTAAGVRSAKVDLVETRLADDIVNISSLQSKNEDANLAEVAMFLSVANTALQAALNLGMKVNQTSLVDYLR
ncbi:MAG: flagellar hook-associated protein FlgL [bacterium]